MIFGMQVATILFLLYSLACTNMPPADPWDMHTGSNVPPIEPSKPIEQLPPEPEIIPAQVSKTLPAKKKVLRNTKKAKKLKKQTKKELDGY